MEKTKWASEGQYDNDYFVDEPAVVEHPVFKSRDIWAVATLMTYGIKLLGFQPNSYRGQGEWLLDNTNDAAWKLATEYRSREDMMAPVRAIKNAYRYAARVAADARGSNSYEQQQRA